MRLLPRSGNVVVEREDVVCEGAPLYFVVEGQADKCPELE